MQSKPVKELDEYAELNLEKVDEFGAEDFLTILTICENHLPPTLATFSEACRTQNAADIKSTAHNLKSNVSYIGTTGLSDIYRTIEVELETLSEKDIYYLTQEATRRTHCLIEEVSRYLSSVV